MGRSLNREQGTDNRQQRTGNRNGNTDWTIPCSLFPVRVPLGRLRPYSYTLLLFLFAALSPLLAVPGAESYITAGLKAYQQGNLEAAAAEFRKGINLKPDSLDAHYHLGRISLIRKDYYGAYDALKEVVALQRGYKNAQELFETRLKGPLEEQIRLDLKVNPRSARAYNVLGFLRLYEGRLNEGITALKYALRFDKSRAAVYDDLAWAHYKLNQFEEAFRYSEKAFYLDPVRASISKHYKQLFYLKKLGFAASDARQSEFYGGGDGPDSPGASGPRTPSTGVASTPEPPAPGSERRDGLPAATGAGRPSTRPNRRPGNDRPSATDGPRIDDRGGGLTSAGSVPSRPAPAPVRTGTRPAPRPDSRPAPLDTSVEATAALTRIQIDDSAIMSAFLKGFKPPRPHAAASSATPTAVATTSPMRKKPPSAAQIASRVRALYKKGIDLAAKTDFEGALQSFELLAQIDPTYRDTMRQLEKMRRFARTQRAFDQAMDLYQTGSFKVALERLRGIDLKTLREFRDVPTLDHLIGECYFHTGKYELAVKKLSSYCEGSPGDVKFRYLLAKSHAELNEHHQALDELAIIRSTDPSYLSRFPESGGLRMKLTIKAYFPIVAFLALIWILMSGGYFIYKLRQAAAARRLRHTLSVAQQAQKNAEWEKMLDACEEFEKKGKTRGDVRVKQSKALALVNLGRLDQARQEVDALPDDPKRQLLRAKLLLETGDRSEEALQEYRILLAAEPNNLKLLQMMNEILQARSATDEEAERILERLIELEPLKTEYVSHLASVHLSRGRYDADAQSTFKKLLDEDPANVQARTGLARCQFAGNHFVEAIREAKQVADFDLENSAIHEILVESYRSLEMIEEGEKEYRRLLTAHPDNPVLLQALARLKAKTDGGGGSISDDELRAAYEKGARLFGEGRFHEAISPLSAAFEGNYQRTCAGALMVRGYLKMHETDTALRVFERMDVFDQPPDEFLLALCYETAEIYEQEERGGDALRLYNFICRNNVNYRDAFQRLERLQSAA